MAESERDTSRACLSVRNSVFCPAVNRQERHQWRLGSKVRFLGSQLFLLQISAIWLIPLRGLKKFSFEPPGGWVTPSRTRTHFGIVIDVSSER